MYGGRESGSRGTDLGGPKPVAVGDELDVTIEAVASRGDGIAKKDGFVIFIKGAEQGKTVHIRITDVRQRYSVGEVIGAGGSAPASNASVESTPDGGSE